MRGEPLAEADWKLLQDRWESFRSNGWQEWSDEIWPPPLAQRRRVIIVTDASDEKWSWLEMEDGKIVGENHSGSFPKGDHKDMVCDRIYYKEFYTVVLAARELTKQGREDIDVTLVGDSRAVMGSFNKGLCPQAAWWIIDELKELFRRGRWGACLKWVESDGNVAHSATHDERIEEYRVKRSWLVVVSDTYPPPAKGGNPNIKKRMRT